MLDWSFTITPEMLLSWQTGIVLLILSWIAFFAGRFPDHNGSPLGTALRYIVWPLLAAYILIRLVRGFSKKEPSRDGSFYLNHNGPVIAPRIRGGFFISMSCDVFNQKAPCGAFGTVGDYSLDR